MTKVTDGPKTCFFIAPIGPEGSDVRLRSDQVLKHIVAPAAKECGYETFRADHISEPGIITSQVIQHVVDDPLVVADLTGRNPNVFYELAIRHASKKPVVQIIDVSETIPFDVAPTRIVQFDHHDLDSPSRAREGITRQIRAVEKNPKDVDTPITVALELQKLRQSDNPLAKSNAEIIVMLQELLNIVRGQERRIAAIDIRAIQEAAILQALNRPFDSDMADPRRSVAAQLSKGIVSNTLAHLLQGGGEANPKESRDEGEKDEK